MIQNDIPVKHFYMLRHGETEANAAKIMAGSLDSPLTKKGREQAQALHLIVKSLDKKPDRIIHSALSRARDTALIINETLNLPMHENPDYAEMDAGDWEGVPYNQCQSLLKSWINPPGGEAYEAFLNRIKMAKTKALKGDEPPLIVSHGGVFRAFFKLYNIHNEGVQNCKLYEFIPKKQARESFPWDVWRYDIEDEVIRKPVDLQNHPASEIAL